MISGCFLRVAKKIGSVRSTFIVSISSFESDGYLLGEFSLKDFSLKAGSL